MLLMIDNYDSFTYNLVQYFGELGEEVMVFRNDEIKLDEIEQLKPARIVISPGPCTPSKAGISVSLIERYQRRDSHIGRLPGSPEHRAGFWRQNRSRQATHAW